MNETSSYGNLRIELLDKQDIYKLLLKNGTIFLRNALEVSLVKYSLSNSHENCQVMSEFLHTIPALLMTDNGGFDSGDLFFLNNSALLFLKNFPQKKSDLFREVCELIELLCKMSDESPIRDNINPELTTILSKHLD